MKSKIKNNGAEPVRVSLSNTSLLNIIPVDYAAKAILRAIERDDIVEMNIVNKDGISIAELGGAIFKCLEYGNYSIVNEEPVKKNHYEELYYKVIGEQFNQYMHSPKAEFSTELLESVMLDVETPDVRRNIPELVEYAYKRKFVGVL